MKKKKNKNNTINYQKYTKTHIALNTSFWFIGLLLIFIIWWILSATLDSGKFVFPTIGNTFKGIGKILGGKSMTYVFGILPEAAKKTAGFMEGKEWAAIGIALGQALMCFVVAYILVAICVYLTHLFKPMRYLFAPFVTYIRTLPAAIIMCIISLMFAGQHNVWIIPIIVTYCIIFPVLYGSLQDAFSQTNAKRIEMGKVYGMNKWQIFSKIIMRQMTPYIFSSLITGFGLTFKVIVASQLVAISICNITPNYPSIGWMIGIDINALNVATITSAQTALVSGMILGWGLITIFISLIFEISFKGISWACMPWTHKRHRKAEANKNVAIQNKEKARAR